MIVERMTEVTNGLFENILQHPFNQQLRDGSLPHRTFAFYLIQDAIYLADYSRALSMAAARLQDHPHVQQFIQFALGAIQAERELHFDYINEYQANDLLNDVSKSEPNPACFMYTNYLLRMASVSAIEEAVASLLPCFYIYHKVGKRMLTDLYPEHPFHDWINLYASDEFEASVQCAVDITNELGSEASDKIRERMVDAYVKSTQLEWLFWDSAYRQDFWPI